MYISVVLLCQDMSSFLVNSLLHLMAMPMYTKATFTFYFIQSTNYEPKLKYLTDLHKIYTKK